MGSCRRTKRKEKGKDGKGKRKGKKGKGEGCVLCVCFFVFDVLLVFVVWLVGWVSLYLVWFCGVLDVFGLLGFVDMFFFFARLGGI